MSARFTYIVMAFFSLFLSTGAHAAYQACEVSTQEDVYWAAIDETITLHFTMKGDGENFLTGKVHIELSDKSKTFIGDIGGYNPHDELQNSDCETEIEYAKESFSGNLSGKYKSIFAENEVTTMGDIAALLKDEAFCSKPANPHSKKWLTEENGRGTNLSKIKDSQVWHSGFLTCNPIISEIGFTYGEPAGMKLDVFNRLVAQNAPLIDVPYAYGSETFVFDRENLKLIYFSYSGC